MALVSMTGFGRGVVTEGNVTVTIELKTVNNRFSDVICKLPSAYAQFETEIAKRVKERIKRGRVEVFVTRVVGGTVNSSVVLNEENFLARLEGAKRACVLSGVKAQEVLPQFIAGVLSRGDVLEMSGVSSEIETKEIDSIYVALLEGINALCAMRGVEGARLETELQGYLDQLVQHVAVIKSRSEVLPEQFKTRLQERIKKLYGGETVDADRLALELAVFADRIDVSEELTRLDSHFMQTRNEFASSGGGRKLEFLLQEMHREVNTIGSKSQDAEVSKCIIEMKTILEKFREQIQNVE